MTLKAKIKLAENIAHLLDSKFGIGPFKFGLDPILGLIPGLGDAIPFLISGYIILVAFQHKVSKTTILKMIFYVVADLLIGTVPVIGDIADFFFKASTKNLELLKNELNIVSKKL